MTTVPAFDEQATSANDWGRMEESLSGIEKVTQVKEAEGRTPDEGRSSRHTTPSVAVYTTRDGYLFQPFFAKITVFLAVQNRTSLHPPRANPPCGTIERGSNL